MTVENTSIGRFCFIYKLPKNLKEVIVPTDILINIFHEIIQFDLISSFIVFGFKPNLWPIPTSVLLEM